jgi:hypothetical protein
MLNCVRTWCEQVERDGFATLPAVFGETEVETVLAELTAALNSSRAGSALRGRTGSVYGARNLLALWPAAAWVWRRPPLGQTLAAVLGPALGLVRVLFFDKPPGGSWALPWHKDLTIAVRDNRLPSRLFGKPTHKAGVPHVEAPLEVLEAMLTARLHLDAVTPENGPLHVLPGSQRTGKALSPGAGVPRPILVNVGDVLLMRPLLAHSSGNADPDTRRHRRILHLEFAAAPALPDGYAWHDFLPGDPITAGP